MKNLTALLLFISLLGYAQDFSKYDKIDVYKDLTINGAIIFGVSKEKAFEFFGEPDKEEEFFYEMSNVNGYIYFYDDGLKLEVTNYVDGFHVNSSKYSVTNNNIKVGDSIEDLKNIYPKSYDYAITNNKEGLVLLLNVDYYLAIVFDKETMKITSISLYEF